MYEIYQVFFNTHYYLSLLIISIIGLCIGSFLNVVIYRIPKENSDFFTNSRSYCPQCNNILKWYHNIPLFSYIYLKGSCAYCKKHISFQYPFVELSNMILYILIYNKYGFSLNSVLLMIIFSLFLVMSFIDFKYQIVHDLFNASALIISLFVFQNTLPFIIALKDNIELALLGAGFMYLLKYFTEILFNKETLGEGDIIICSTIFVLSQNFLSFYNILFISSFLTLFYFIYLKFSKKDIIYVGFIPFLFIGLIINYLTPLNLSFF